jgi:hypothetical protein
MKEPDGFPPGNRGNLIQPSFHPSPFHFRSRVAKDDELMVHFLSLAPCFLFS